MARLPWILRAALLGLIALALLFPRLWSPAPAAPRVVRFGAAPATAASLRPFAGETPPALFVRSSRRPPSAAELTALRAAGTLAPVVVALPEGRAVVHADPPASARAGRAAALQARVGGRPGETVTLRLADDAGPLDSARVTLDAGGRGQVAFRIRPPRAGWREWTIAVGGDTARTGAWVDSAPAPRVQVRAGLPSWESKFVTRALEESGAVVDLSLSLGRGLGVAGGDAGASPALDGPSRPDVVIALDGAGLGDADRAALVAFADGGGGVLLAGDQASAALGVAGAGGADGPARGDRIRWSLPADLATLPSAPLRSDARTLGASLPTATTVGAAGDAGPLLVLRPAGRGRAAGLGLRETWRWRMEAGRVAEHREFWRSLVDWLDAAPAGGFSLSAGDPIVPVGEAVSVRLLSSSAAPPPPVVVTRPDGTRDTLPVSSGEGDARGIRFVSAADGVHLLSLGDGPPLAAIRAETRGAPGDAWTSLALAAWESGGAAVPASALEGEIARRVPRADDHPPADRRALLLAAILLLAAAEWAIRRVAGSS